MIDFLLLLVCVIVSFLLAVKEGAVLQYNLVKSGETKMKLKSVIKKAVKESKEAAKALAKVPGAVLKKCLKLLKILSLKSVKVVLILFGLLLLIPVAGGEFLMLLAEDLDKKIEDIKHD